MDGIRAADNNYEFRCERDNPLSSPSRTLARQRIFLPFMLALLLPPVQSDAQHLQETEDSVGLTLICNTAQQLSRFIDLINAGHGGADALRLVNDEAENPTACGNAMVAFEVGKTVAQAKLLGELVNIVEVQVFALSVGSEWQQVPPTAQYTIRRDRGEAL